MEVQPNFVEQLENAISNKDLAKRAMVLGRVADLFAVADPADARRPQRRAGDDEAGDGGQLEAAEDEHDGHRRREDHDQVAEEHVSLSGVR